LDDKWRMEDYVEKWDNPSLLLSPASYLSI
jgi:hypothetical protein